MARALKKRLNICFMAWLLAALTAGCGGGGGGGDSSASKETNQPADTTKPWVVFTVPWHNAQGVAINSKIAATFSEDMDSATITAGTFTVEVSGSAVQGTVTYDATSRTAILTHGELTANTVYTATIATGIKDLAGNAVAVAYTWSFTTGVMRDDTPPTVLSTIPAHNALNVALNTAIALTFSEAMNPFTVTAQTFTLWQNGAIPVAGSVVYIGPTAFFKPAGNLSANSAYTAEIAGEAGGAPWVEDLAGNPMISNYVFEFTTGSALDITPPQIVSTNPPDGAINVPVDTSIDATFDEPMLPFAGGLIDGRPVIVTFDPAYTTASMQSTVGLKPSSHYTATANFQDLAGNRMAARYTWGFTTAP